jgi:hypothetical protein
MLPRPIPDELGADIVRPEGAVVVRLEVPVGRWGFAAEDEELGCIVMGVLRTFVVTAPFSATRCDICAGLRKLPRATPKPAEPLAITTLFERAFDMVATGPRFTASVRPPLPDGGCNPGRVTPATMGVLPKPAHDPPGVHTHP